MSDMADVLREKFAIETDRLGTVKIWATPEDIAAALSAAGFGPVREARVPQELANAIGWCDVCKRNWAAGYAAGTAKAMARARAAAERGGE